MKKIISFLLSLSVILSCIGVSAETVQKSEFKINTEKLMAFGIMKTKTAAAAKAEVTANDWYTLLAHMILCETPEELIPRNIVPVTADGKISGQNRVITTKAAIESAVKALGYDLIAEGKHYEYGLNLGLADGITTGANLTCEDMLKLALNVCETEVMQASIYKDGFAYTKEEDETLLIKYHDIYKVKGIINETAGISVSSKKTGSKIYTTIDETQYLTGDVDVKEYLGMQVEAYYLDNSNEEGKLLYVEPTAKNDVTVITDMDNVAYEEISKTTYAYYEGEKTRKIKISKAADMVYNDLANPDFTVADLTPDTGSVKLIDNNNDGEVDCIIVNAYRTLVIESASLTSEIINVKFGTGYDLENYDSYKIIKGNAPASISDLKTWDIVYAMEDKEHKNIVFTVSDKGSVTGKITRSDLTEKEIYIDGTLYKINPEYFGIAPEGTFNNTDERVYYLDADGRVAAIGKSSGNVNQYGWLYRMWNDEQTDVAFVQLLTTEGEWEQFELAEKIKFNGESVKSAIISTLLDPDQLIRYRTNASEIITRIETAKQVADGSDSDEFRMMYANGIYRTEDASLSNSYYFGPGMSVFQIPVTEELKRDKDSYSVGGWRYADYTHYSNVEFYDPTENNVSSVLVRRLDPGGDDLSSSPMFIVESVGDALIGDEIVTRAKGLVVGQHLSITAEESSVFENIKPGDAIQFLMNPNGRVKKVSIVCKADESDRYTNVKGAEFHVTSCVQVCQIVKVDAENKFLRVRGADGERVIKVDSASFAIYNKSKKKAEDATIADLQAGDSMIFYARHSLVRNVCVYRDR